MGLFVCNGIDGTSVRQIAAASGFTNPAIFKHFDSKEALARCLFERCYIWMGEAFKATDKSGPSGGEQKILAVVECALRLIDEDNEAVLYVEENLRRFWRRTSAETKRFSLLGHIRGLIAEAGGSPFEQKLQASAIAGFLAQVAREVYFKELLGTALDQKRLVNAIVIRILGGAGRS